LPRPSATASSSCRWGVCACLHSGSVIAWCCRWVTGCCCSRASNCTNLAAGGQPGGGGPEELGAPHHARTHPVSQLHSQTTIESNRVLIAGGQPGGGGPEELGAPQHAQHRARRHHGAGRPGHRLLRLQLPGGRCVFLAPCAAAMVPSLPPSSSPARFGAAPPLSRAANRTACRATHIPLSSSFDARLSYSLQMAEAQHRVAGTFQTTLGSKILVKSYSLHLSAGGGQGGRAGGQNPSTAAAAVCASHGCRPWPLGRPHGAAAHVSAGLGSQGTFGSAKLMPPRSCKTFSSAAANLVSSGLSSHAHAG